MEMTFRWFGSKYDRITLEQIRQIPGVTGIVTTLYGTAPGEVWKTKETKVKKEDNPKLGDEKKRSILMEAVTAMSLLVAGADILIMRHPDAITLVRDMIKELTN